MEDEDLATRVAELLNGRAIATAESCTAGRVAEVLACVDNASDFLRGGVVAYQEAVKRDLLHVTADSVLTSQAAEEMAHGVSRLLDAQVAVSTTGVAGDHEEDGTPPGTVYIGTAVDDTVTSRVHHFDGSPQEICDQARRQALLDLIDAFANSKRSVPDPAPASIGTTRSTSEEA
jgi:nicotinamide-nucleotide amidase